MFSYRNTKNVRNQYYSQSEGKEQTPASGKIEKMGEIWNLREKKKRKNQEEKTKIGRFFHFAPPDRGDWLCH